jgi:hypothetical protein
VRAVGSRWVLATWLVLALPARGLAEPGTAVLAADARGPGPLGDVQEVLELELLARARSRPAALSVERVQALSRLDSLLGEARAHAAALQEDAALAALADAARIGEQLGDVPGAAAWNAEAQLRLGMTALQLGHDELAAAAFRRAATLEPARVLLAAEASPEVVTRYETARALVAAAPDGELRVRASVAGARVYLDDVAQGVAPRSLRTKVGRHVLRVEAAGHRPYGTFIDVLAGERPEIVIELSELPELRAARALIAAAAARDYARLPGLVAELGELEITAALVVETSPSGRRLLVRCDAQRCAGPSRVEQGVPPTLPDHPLQAAALRAGRDWLGSSPPARDAAEPPLWQRWYVWAAAAALVSVSVGTALALQPEPRRELRIVVNPPAANSP